jgi:hypothetical protein
MANGFRDLTQNGLLTIVRWVAKSPAGNDSNTGTIPNTPLATIPSITTGYTQIGAGQYNLGNSGNSSAHLADGLVLLKNLTINTTGASLRRTGVIYENVVLNLGVTNPNSEFLNCTLKNVSGSWSGSSRISNNVKIINTNPSLIIRNQGSSQINSIRFSIFINCLIRTNVSDLALSAGIQNSYISLDSTFENYRILSFTNCNFNGILQYTGDLFSDLTPRQYAIQDQFTGTPQDNGYPIGVEWISESKLISDGFIPTVTGWDARIADSIINRDPKFNNAAIEDFTLQADSPHIGRATDGSNIGGTSVAQSTLVNQDGVGTIEIITSPEIDTSIPDSFKLAVGEIQGFIRIILRASALPRPALRIDPLGLLEFDSSIAGGSVGNRNVPDSEPLSADYPRKLTTTSLASNTTTLNVTGHDVVAGEFVRVAGEDREVLSVTTDVITVDSAFRAAVASGVTFQVGTEIQLASLRPNRLTYQLRTSTQFNKPATESEWDNGIDPIYGMAGEYLTQEWNTRPQYVIDVDDSVYGAGDTNADPALPKSDHVGTWFDIKVWIRNDYGS